jgi:hypothetical protein
MLISTAANSTVPESPYFCTINVNCNDNARMDMPDEVEWI